MKGVSLLLSGLCFILLEIIRSGEAELPVALYVAEGNYKLESLNEIKKNLPSSRDSSTSKSVGTDSVPKAVLSCSDDTTDNKSHFITRLIRTREELTNSNSLCKKKSQPSINEASEPAMNFITDPPTSIVNIQSGYWVCDRNGILEKNSLKPFKNNRNCDFFSTMRILFDSSKSIARQVRYDINIKEQYDDIIKKCENFNVGITNLANGNDINEAYEKNSQNEALQNTFERVITKVTPLVTVIEIHPSLPPLIEVCGLKIEGGAKNRNELSEDEKDYFIRQPLASTFHFGDNSLAFTVCSLQNIVPMWEEIATHVWMPMQKFVQNLAKKIGKKLSIITGTKDTLELLEYNTDPDVCSKRTIKLGGAEVEVPREFWTVVMYHVTGAQTYGMILVVNNDKLSEIKNGCEVVDCQLNGWPEEKTPFNFKQSYCCKFNKKNLDYFNIEISELTEKLLDLNLKKVPIKEENSNKVSWKDLTI